MTRTPLATLALLLAIVSACGEDDPEPRIAPSEPAASSPTESESTSAPPEPERLSPEETVRAWVEARNETVRDGSTDAVYALSSSSCRTCRDSVEPVAQVYRDGGRYETEGWRVNDAKRQPSFERTGEVAVAVTFTAGRTYRTANAEPIEYEAEKQLFLFQLRRENGSWVVHKILYVS